MFKYKSYKMERNVKTKNSKKEIFSIFVHLYNILHSTFVCLILVGIHFFFSFLNVHAFINKFFQNLRKKRSNMSFLLSLPECMRCLKFLPLCVQRTCWFNKENPHQIHSDFLYVKNSFFFVNPIFTEQFVVVN